MREFSKDHSDLALNTATPGHLFEGCGAGWSPEEVVDACAKPGFINEPVVFLLLGVFGI